jgi:hypothetical protein
VNGNPGSTVIGPVNLLNSPRLWENYLPHHKVGHKGGREFGDALFRGVCKNRKNHGGNGELNGQVPDALALISHFPTFLASPGSCSFFSSCADGSVVAGTLPRSLMPVPYVSALER